MKAVILAGGFGSRLSEETTIKPKPMVEIGGKPILWHIMKIFSAYGINEFIIALGYKSEVIKEYFINYYAINNNISINLETGENIIHDGNQTKWIVHLVDTGLYTQTGGRLKRLKSWLQNDKQFLFTYGDGVADIDIKSLIAFHKSHTKIATVTTVRVPARFGRIAYDGDKINSFFEKPEGGEGWINGGFFVLDSAALDYIDSDETVWEGDTIKKLCADNELMGFRHQGFWSCMDTLKEKKILEDMWYSGDVPWKVWEY